MKTNDEKIAELASDIVMKKLIIKFVAAGIIIIGLGVLHSSTTETITSPTEIFGMITAGMCVVGGAAGILFG